IREIAREKAGIMRAGTPVVTLPQLPEANDMIGHAALEVGARAVSAVPYVPPVSPNSTQYLVPSTQKTPCQRYPLQVMGREIMVAPPLVGRHQLRNPALAAAAAEELHNAGFPQITSAAIERGIRETRWPGRFQVLPAAAGRPVFVLDVAHNPAG